MHVKVSGKASDDHGADDDSERAVTKLSVCVLTYLLPKYIAIDLYVHTNAITLVNSTAQVTLC